MFQGQNIASQASTSTLPNYDSVLLARPSPIKTSRTPFALEALKKRRTLNKQGILSQSIIKANIGQNRMLKKGQKLQVIATSHFNDRSPSLKTAQ